MPGVGISQLANYATERDMTLRGLPFLTLKEYLENAGISLSRYTTKEVKTELLRKGGLSRPYTTLDADKDSKMSAEIMKLADLPIEPVMAYFEHIDNIMNYNKPEVLVTLKRSLDVAKPKHPFEDDLKAVVSKTLPEDVLLSSYFGVRKDAGNTALDSYNGLFKQKSNLVVAGVLSEAAGNYLATPALIDNAKPTNAYDVVLSFLKRLPVKMTMGEFYLKMSPDAALKAMEACEAKYPYGGAISLEVLETRLRNAANCPNMKLRPTLLVGVGDYLEASVVGATELSFAPDGIPFLDVRSPFRDKNIIQFWAQYMVATRICTVSPTKFVCNQATNTMPTNLFGDY